MFQHGSMWRRVKYLTSSSTWTDSPNGMAR